MEKNEHKHQLSRGKWRKILLIMKLKIFFLLCIVQMANANSFSQVQKLDVNFSDTKIVSVLDFLKSQTGMQFFYQKGVVSEVAKVTVDMKNATLEQVLDKVLVENGYSYEILDEVVIVRRMEPKEKTPRVIVGKVVDEKKVPMPGVTVRLDSTVVGTATDSQGVFKLAVGLDKGTLVFSFIGYKMKRVKFDAAKQDTIRVTMEEDVSGLDEVTVVAYGSQKRRLMTSSVSSIKGSEIQELPTHSLESLLQGRMAGVEVNNLSGAPGGGGSIVAVRGYNTIRMTGESEDRNAGTPLYVVDGVPFQAFTSDVTGANTLANLDPSMIESIEVLKDAAAASLYGSRASNGVVLITTKKGRSGKGHISATFSYSAAWLPKTIEMTGGHGERMYALNAFKNAREPYYDSKTGEWKLPTSYEEVYQLVDQKNNGPVYNAFWGGKKNAGDIMYLQDSLNPFFNNSTDWWRYMYRTAKVLNANVQASGGNDAVQYVVGLGYYNEEGIMLGTDFQRATLAANLSATPMKRFKMDLHTIFAYSDRSRGGDSRGGSGVGQKIEGISVDPNSTSTLLPGGSYVEENMLEDLNAKIEKNNSYTLRLNMKLDYEFIRDLHLSVTGALDFNQQNQNKFLPSSYNRQDHYSSSEGTIARSITLLNENLLNYNFSLKQVHNIGVMLGLSFEKSQNFTNKGSGTKGPNDYVHYVGSGWGGSDGILYPGTGTVPASAFSYNSELKEETMCSYFGRLTYNYKEKYLLEATIRRDGSSVFGEDVRWATFPSVSAGWAFSEEPFMKRLYWLNFGKIRGSWGTSGLKFSQPYLAQGLFTSGSRTFLGQYGMMQKNDGGLINPKLSWEKTDQYNIGLDLDLMNYRFKVVLDYYYRYTKDQLNKIDIPGDMYLFTNQWQNAMETSNEGIEVELMADILRETAVKWKMKLTASRNWSRFEKSNNGMDFLQQVIGKPLYQMKVYKTDGFYNSMEEVPYMYTASGKKQLLYTGSDNGIFYPGTRRIMDLNGDGKINDDDRYYAASPLPQVHGGIFFDLRWKDFDLNMAFNYSLGRHILRTYDDSSLSPGIQPNTPIRVDLSDVHAWENAGTKNPSYPYLQSYQNNDMQYEGLYDSDIEKVNLLRLKQLTLGYNLNKRIVEKTGLTSARIYMTMENLFLWTNYEGLDPEIVSIYDGIDNLGSYPLPRKFTVGLSINF